MTDDMSQVEDATAAEDRLRSDWLTIWQSEVAALAADREGQELWAACVSRWAGSWAGLMAHPAATGWWSAWAGALQHAAGAAADGPDGPAGSVPAARATAAGAAPDDLAALHRRIAELERRVAAGGA